MSSVVSYLLFTEIGRDLTPAVMRQQEEPKMTPQMQEVLYQMSLCYDPEPTKVYQKIAEAISHYYDGATSAVNLFDGNQVLFRTVVNPPPSLKRMNRAPTRYTY